MGWVVSSVHSDFLLLPRYHLPRPYLSNPRGSLKGIIFYSDLQERNNLSNIDRGKPMKQGLLNSFYKTCMEFFRFSSQCTSFTRCCSDPQTLLDKFILQDNKKESTSFHSKRQFCDYVSIFKYDCMHLVVKIPDFYLSFHSADY